MQFTIPPFQKMATAICWIEILLYYTSLCSKQKWNEPSYTNELTAFNILEYQEYKVTLTNKLRCNERWILLNHDSKEYLNVPLTRSIQLWFMN